MKAALSAALGLPALLSLVYSGAHAQSTDARLPTAVITPSRITQSLDDISRFLSDGANGCAAGRTKSR